MAHVVYAGNTDHETGDIGVQWLLLARIRFTSLMSERDLQRTCHCTAPGRSSQIRACPAEMVACRNQIASDLLRRQVACAKGNAPPRELSVRHRLRRKQLGRLVSNWIFKSPSLGFRTSGSYLPQAALLETRIENCSTDSFIFSICSCRKLTLLAKGSEYTK